MLPMPDNSREFLGAQSLKVFTSKISENFREFLSAVWLIKYNSVLNGQFVRNSRDDKNQKKK